MDEGNYSGIWLEVAEVRYELEASKGAVRVSLRGDREHPKPVWWSVDEAAVGISALDTYKAILNELDKKRVAIAWLTQDLPEGSSLVCRALRFQSPELPSR